MKTRKNIGGLGAMTGKMTKGEIRRRRGSRERKRRRNEMCQERVISRMAFSFIGGEIIV